MIGSGGQWSCSSTSPTILLKTYFDAGEEIPVIGTIIYLTLETEKITERQAWGILLIVLSGILPLCFDGWNGVAEGRCLL
jgi:hypothetical protein